jgi:hypothetical protein
MSLGFVEGLSDPLGLDPESLDPGELHRINPGRHTNGGRHPHAISHIGDCLAMVAARTRDDALGPFVFG